MGVQLLCGRLQPVVQILERPLCHVANKLRLITWIESLRYSEHDTASGMTRETDTLTGFGAQLLKRLATPQGEMSQGRVGMT